MFGKARRNLSTTMYGFGCISMPSLGNLEATNKGNNNANG